MTETITTSAGDLTLPQWRCLLETLPGEFTFIDENDRIAFYTQKPEPLFERTEDLLGTDIRDCHTTSLLLLEEMLDTFRKGHADQASVWKQETSGRFLLTTYFAVRDPDGTYRGTLEEVRDLAHDRSLPETGENWPWKKDS